MKLRNKKTGEIWDIGKVLTCDYPSYETLKQLNEDWEDYQSAEPLIKDEKIRKVVRLCADIWESDKILVAKQGSVIEFSDGYVRYVTFMYAEWQDEIKDRTYYTIAELCGEEEE